MMSTLVFVDPESSTQADEAQSSRVPVPLPKDPYKAIRHAYLVGTDTESGPFEGKARTPESPHIVAPPTCHVEELESCGTSGARSTSSDSTAPLSPDHPLTHTTPALVPILHKTTRMAVRVSPAMSPGLYAGIAEGTIMAPPFKVSNEGLTILERVYQESSVWQIPDDIRTALVNQVGQNHTYIDNLFRNRRKKDKGTWGKETAPPQEQQAPIPPPLPLAQSVYDPIIHQPEHEYPMFEENYEHGGANNEQGVTMDDPFYHAEGGANNEQDVTIDDLFLSCRGAKVGRDVKTIARGERANESKIGKSDAGATTSGKPIAGTFATMGIGGECS
nr:hypothetical protein [Tanacetum cinerariifolium]